MANDEKLRDFLTILKVAFKNAAIYNSAHPAFHKSLSDLHESLLNLLRGHTSLKLGFSPDSLVINGVFLENEALFRELARMFHFRKLKTLEFLPGISFEELKKFILQVFASPQEIIRKGGMEIILDQERVKHVQVEELDYSQLLRGEGDEIREIWPYLLADVVDNPDPEVMSSMADSYEKISTEIPADTIFADRGLSENFTRFMDYLKENDQEHFQSCAKRLVKTSLHRQELETESKIDELRTLFTDLDEKQMAETFWDEILTSADFDILSFSIFSRLMEKKRHSEVARSLSEIFHENEELKSDPKVKEKIKTLLSTGQGVDISEIYRQTLTLLIEDIDYKDQWSFDRTGLGKSYRFMLLNLLEMGAVGSSFANIASCILEEWNTIRSDRDYEFLKLLYEFLMGNEGDGEGAKIRKMLLDKIKEFIENSILMGEMSLYFDYFIQNFKTSGKNINVYLSTIFESERVTPYIFQALFRFFIEYLFYFNLNIERNADNPRLLEKIVEGLEPIDSPVSLVALKSVFQVNNPALRIKTLKAMQGMKEFDPKFLLKIIKHKDPQLIKEALVILMRCESSARTAFDRLLTVESIYGFRNRYILRNIAIVSEGGFLEASDHLETLSRRGGFWNRNVRDSARRVLENLNAEEN